MYKSKLVTLNSVKTDINKTSGYATWFTARGAIRIALRQLLQNRKLRHL